MTGYDYEGNARQRLECLDCARSFSVWADAEKHQNQTRHKVKYNEIETKSDLRCKCTGCKHGRKGGMKYCFSKACACCTVPHPLGIIHKVQPDRLSVTKNDIQALKAKPVGK